MATLHDAIDDAANNVFLDKNRFAEDLTLYVGGGRDYETTVPFVGVWDAQARGGTSSGEEGSGRMLQTAGGRRVRSDIFVEAPRSLDVDESRDPPDRIKRDSTGEWVAFKRVEADDRAMKLLYCVGINEITARQPKVRG